MPAGEVLPDHLNSIRADRLLHDGDRVGALRVIATPGHSLGHVAFLDERDRSLIAGDALFTAGGTHVPGERRPTFPVSYLIPTADQALALSSARRLLNEHPARLAVGHGPVLDHPQAAIARAVVRAARRLDAARARTLKGA